MTAAKAKPVISTVTCKVVEVVALGAARVSRIACDGPFDDDPNIRVDGVWVAANGGLVRATLDWREDPPHSVTVQRKL